MSTKTTATLETIERILDEVDEWHGRVRTVRQKLRRARRGSEAYLDLLPDLWVELDVLARKARWAAEVLEDFEESLAEGEKP